MNKLREAMHVLGISAGSGCAIDLGAAPGSWTAELADTYSCVIAVDPGQLDPLVLAKPNVHHVQLKSSDARPDIVCLATASAAPVAVQTYGSLQHLHGLEDEQPAGGLATYPVADVSWQEHRLDIE